MSEMIGVNLKKYRLQKGLTLKGLSSTSGIKLTTLSAIERGRIKNPSFDSLRRVAATLDIPREFLWEDRDQTPLWYQGSLKGAVQFEYKPEGLTLISYTPLLKEIFVGKAVLKAKRQWDLGEFPSLRFLFIQMIFGKIEIKWKSKSVLITEGDNLALSSPIRQVLANPLQIKDASFLVVSTPSLVSANLENQKPLS